MSLTGTEEKAPPGREKSVKGIRSSVSRGTIQGSHPDALISDFQAKQPPSNHSPGKYL